MNPFDIDHILQKAREKKWPYPQIFDALKNAGVERYEVDVLKHEIKYVGGKTSVVHPPPADFQAPACGDFNPTAFKQALDRAQKQESTYPQFLAEIAAAGIVWYRVDMGPRTVTYHGKDKRDKIVESVPAA